jgi:hypothetical protein
MWEVAANKRLTLSQVNKSSFTIVVVKVVVVGAVAVAAVLVVCYGVLPKHNRGRIAVMTVWGKQRWAL